jgi:DNA-binding MarR family transcriptional regulator
MLERMEKSGLIIRQQDPGDKRKTLLFLTDMAKALKDDYDAISDRMSEIYYQGFTEDEIRTFEACLERIRLNLEGWQPK